MSKPIKEYSLGKCKAAIFQGDYEGKPTYSVKFQKSYKGKDGWKNTDYFNLTDLRDLYGLVGFMLNKQVKERKQNNQNDQNVRYSTQNFVKDMSGQVAVDQTDGDVPF